MSLNKKVLALMLVILVICALIISSAVSQLFETKPQETAWHAHTPAVQPAAETPFEPLVTEEIKMNPGTRKFVDEKTTVKPEAAGENQINLAAPREPEAEAISEGPANPLPTDEQIEASIREQNEKKETAEKLLAQRDKKVASVTQSVRSLGQSQLSPEKVPEQSPNQTPSGQIVEKVRSGEYVYN